jgi:hypothetical protein
MNELIDFLIICIERDKVYATMRTVHGQGCDSLPTESGYTYPCDCGVPERMMREIRAKERILSMYIAFHREFESQRLDKSRGDTYERVGPGVHAATNILRDAARSLANVYSDQPGYRESWAR